MVGTCPYCGGHRGVALNVTERQAAMLEAGRPALPWDLTFPGVFVPDGADGRPGGFDAVLSNPPWDIMQQNTAEFLAGLDLSVLDASTKGDAMAIQNRLLAEPRAANAFRRYQLGFQQQHRLVDRLYRHQKLGARDEPMGGKLDSFRVFAERKMQLVGPQGAVGMLVPRRSTPMKALRPYAGSICGRHSWNGAYRSRIGGSCLILTAGSSSPLSWHICLDRHEQCAVLSI